MKGLFERSREDGKLLLSKLGFAVSLPLAGYFVINSNQHTSSSASAESGAVGKSAGPVSTGGGRNLKDEIHIQESEEALARMIHGTSSTITTTSMAISAIEEHSSSSKNPWHGEGCLLPQLKQLPLQNPESSLMRLTHSELDAKKVDMDQEISLIQERERSHAIDYYGPKKQGDAIRELEDQLETNMMKAKSLSLKIQSSNEENRRLRIQDSGNSGTISEVESVVMMIKCLIRALTSEWLPSRQKMDALEQRITMLDDKKHKDDAEMESNLKILKELEDEYTNLSKTNLSMEQKKNLMLVQRSEFAGNLASSCCTIKGQEVQDLEASCLIEANEKAKGIEQLPDDDHSAEIEKMLDVRRISACLKCEQRKCESEYANESLSAKTEKKVEQILLEYANLGINDEKNIYMRNFDMGDCSSQKIINESMNSSSDMSSVTNNSSVGGSKHQRSHRVKFFSKLKMILLGKHSHNKGKFFLKKTPINCATSDTRESLSSCCLDDLRSNNSCDLFETRSSNDERWQSSTAWCQSCFRSPFQLPGAKIHDLQEEDISE